MKLSSSPFIFTTHSNVYGRICVSKCINPEAKRAVSAVWDALATISLKFHLLLLGVILYFFMDSYSSSSEWAFWGCRWCYQHFYWTFLRKKKFTDRRALFSHYCAPGSHVFKAQLSSPSPWNGCIFTPVQLILSHGKGVNVTSTLENKKSVVLIHTACTAPLGTAGFRRLSLSISTECN